MSQLKIYNH